MSTVTLTMMAQLAKAIPEILQLDRLERLSKRHPILAVSYSAMINQINAILIATDAVELGGFEIGPYKIPFTARKFDASKWEDKLGAISMAFQIETERLHDLMEASLIKDYVHAAATILNTEIVEGLSAFMLNLASTKKAVEQ